MVRPSFAGIEIKEHADVESRVFNYEKHELEGEQNEVLTKAIIEIFSDEIKKVSTVTGEWQWLQRNKQKGFIDSLIKGDTKEISLLLTNMFKNEATYGYISPSFSDALKNEKSVSSNILCNIDTCIEFSDLSSEKQLETSHGNPFGLCCSEGTVLPDTPRHYYYSYVISKLLNTNKSPSIFEIGGGYGGFCLETWKRFKGNCTITNIDLLPGLIATYFYLSKNKIPVNFVRTGEEIKKNSINLICADTLDILDLLRNNTDLVFNSRSLCEMSKDTISSYFNFINYSGSDYCYHENSNFILFPKSERHIEICADDFPIDESKYLLQHKSITPFTGGDGRYREYFYKKKK